MAFRLWRKPDRHVGQRVTTDLARNQVDGLWQRVALQEFSLAFAGFFFFGGPGRPRSAAHLPSFSATAPLLFPLRDQRWIELSGIVWRAGLHVERIRTDDDREQFADLIRPASLNGEMRERVALRRNIDDLARRYAIPIRRRGLRREDQIGFAHRPVGVDFAINDVKVAVLLSRNFYADPDALSGLEGRVSRDSLGCQLAD